MWSYRVRKTAKGIDIAGAWGYPTATNAIRAYKKRFSQWEKYHCAIYGPDAQPRVEKAAGERMFR